MTAARAKRRRPVHVREVIIPAVRLLCEDCNLPAAEGDRLCEMCRAAMDREWASEVVL